MDRRLEALKRYNQAKWIVNRGQSLDMEAEFKLGKTEDYLNIIGMKTAYLFRTSASIGAILADADESVIAAFENYGQNAGLAFQIQDDILELTDPEAKGHEYGSDIKKGKATLPLILALESCSQEEKAQVGKIIGNESATRQDLDNVKELMDKHDIYDKSKDQALIYIRKAKGNLEIIKDILKIKSLDFHEGFADYMLGRLR